MKKDANAKGASIWTPTFAILCLVNLFQLIGQMMMITIMPLYAQVFGASETMIGLVVGMFAVSALLSRPFVSPAFDSFPKKWILLGAELLIAACSFLYGFAVNIPSLLLVRILHGLAMGCTGPLVLALVSENLPVEKYGSGIGLFSLTQALSQALGPALGLFLIAVIGFQWTFLLSGFSILFSSVLILFVNEPERKNRPKYKVALNRCFAKNSIPPAVINGIICGVHTSIMAFIAIYAGLRGVEQIGLFFTVQALVLFATRPLFGKLADRLGFAKVLIPSMFLYCAAFLIICASNSLPMFIVAALFSACGYGTCSPLLQAIVMGSVPRDRSGAASSTNYTAIDTAQLIGPSLAGMLIEFFYARTGDTIAAYQSMYMCEIAIVFVAIALFALLYKTMKKNMDAMKAAAKIEKAE